MLLWRVQFALHLGLSRTGTPQSLLLYAGLLYVTAMGILFRLYVCGLYNGCTMAVQWLYLCVLGCG